MTDRNPPDLVSHPHVDLEPIRTGNPAETLADREDVIFASGTDAEGRLSGGYFALIVVGVLLILGGAVVWNLSALWPG